MRALVNTKSRMRPRHRPQQIRKLLIVFATLAEAEMSLQQLKATPLIKDELFVFSRGHILISGIGSLNAAIKLAQYIHLAKEVWNIGLAGALDDRHEVGTILTVQSMAKFLPQAEDLHSEEVAKKSHPLINTGRVGVRLISSDVPIHNAALRATLSENFDLVDMEGYGIASCAHAFHKPAFLWKCVSDFASLGGQHLIKQYLHDCSQKMADFLRLC